jgi:thymidylate synthase (FAD)
MDEHAQEEIRNYATCMFNIVSELFPIASQAFKDYRLDAVTFSAMEMEVLKEAISLLSERHIEIEDFQKPSSMTDNEWKAFIKKLS